MNSGSWSRGQKIRIKKGLKFYSLIGPFYKEAQRDYTTRIHHVEEDRVVWIGAEGYYCWANKNEVELKDK